MIFLKSQIQLGLGVHDDGSAPGDWFRQGFTAEQQKSDARRPGCNVQRVPGIEKDQGAVLYSFFSYHPLARDDVDERRVVAGHGVDELHSGRQVAIQIFGLNDDVVHGAAHRVQQPRDDLYPRAARQLDFRNLFCRQAPVARGHHFFGGRKIGPELKAVHGPMRIALGHFLMNDAGTGGHPLHVAAGDDALVAEAVCVLHVPPDDIGDGLDAPVRMPGKAALKVFRLVGPEVVKHEERIEIRGFGIAEDPAQFYARTLGDGFAFVDGLDGTSHGSLPGGQMF